LYLKGIMDNLDRIIREKLIEEIRTKYYIQYKVECKRPNLTFEECINLHAFHVHLNNAYEEKIRKFVAPSKLKDYHIPNEQWFRRMFIEEGKSYQGRTRKSLVVFLGYKDIMDFQDKNGIRHIALTPTEHIDRHRKRSRKIERLQTAEMLAKDIKQNNRLVDGYTNTFPLPSSSIHFLDLNEKVSETGRHFDFRIFYIFPFIMLGLTVFVLFNPSKPMVFFNENILEFDYTQQHATLSEFKVKNYNKNMFLEVYGLRFDADLGHFERFKISDSNNVPIKLDFPGVYVAQVFENNKRIGSQNIYAYTHKWIASCIQHNYDPKEEEPKVLDKELFSKNGVATVDVIDSRRMLWVNFFIVDTFGVNADSIDVEVHVRNADSFSEGNDIRLWVIGENGRGLAANFTRSSNVLGHSYVVLSDTIWHYASTFPEIKSFVSFNPLKWNVLKFEIRTGKLIIRNNGEMLGRPFPYQNKLGRLYGLRITFKGGGELDYVKVRNMNNNDLIMYEEFDLYKDTPSAKWKYE